MWQAVLLDCLVACLAITAHANQAVVGTNGKSISLQQIQEQYAAAATTYNSGDLQLAQGQFNIVLEMIEESGIAELENSKKSVR
jgi:hypothetical protein